MNEEIQFDLSVFGNHEQPAFRERRGVGLVHSLLSALLASGKAKPGDEIQSRQVFRALKNSGRQEHFKNAIPIGDVLGKHGLRLHYRYENGRYVFILPLVLPVVDGDVVVREAVYETNQVRVESPCPAANEKGGVQ